jgi:hypothetical protein
VISVKVTEPYAVDDILDAIDRQAAEDTWTYALLYDLRTVDVSADEDAQRLAAHAKVAGQGRLRGPVGIAITPHPEHFRRAHTYSTLTGNVEILLNATQLDEWLVRNAPRRA